nr:vesicle-associated protein 2-2-like [Ipomoea batatas]
MQAQREPPPDMICKDKFLVQGATVPEGTTEEDITSEMFAKDDGKYVQENKLRVILVNPSDSPVLSPMNGVHSHQARNVFADDVFGSAKFSALSELAKNMGLKQENGKELVDTKLLESKSRKDIEELESFKEVMKSKLNELELQLSAVRTLLSAAFFVLLFSPIYQAEATIARLTEERKEIARERESLQRELAIMTSKKVVKKVHVGFPLIYNGMAWHGFYLCFDCVVDGLEAESLFGFGGKMEIGAK